MNPPLKVGDKVRTATALSSRHWTDAEKACRKAGAEGTILHCYPAGLVPLGQCCICIQHGCYKVEHSLGCVAYYHGDELTLVTQGKPEDAALQAQLICPRCNHDLIARTIGHGLISLVCRGCGWKGASLWLDPVPERVMPIRRKGEPGPDDEPDGGRLGERVEALSGQLDALLGRVAALEQPPAPEPVDSSAAVDAADSWWCRELADALHVPVTDGNELLHRLRARLDAYRGLRQAAAGWWADIHCEAPDPEVSEVEEQLGVTPDKSPAAIHDDSSLDPPRPAAHCERCAADQTVQLLTDKLNGILQELAEAVDTADADLSPGTVLARALRRCGVVQRIIMSRDPEQLRKAARWLRGFADGDDASNDAIATMLFEIAAISRQERD